MTKSTKMWSVIDVNYNYGNAKGDLHSFVTEQELRDYLVEQLNSYSSYLEVDYTQTIDNIETLINYTIEVSQEMINRYECGVEAVNMLDFETQTITVYK